MIRRKFPKIQRIFSIPLPFERTSMSFEGLAIHNVNDYGREICQVEQWKFSQ